MARRGGKQRDREDGGVCVRGSTEASFRRLGEERASLPYTRALWLGGGNTWTGRGREGFVVSIRARVVR